MRTSLRKVAPFIAVAVMGVGAVVILPAGHADGGCIAGDAAGQVARNARPGDNVCVPPAIAALVATENANPTANRDPNGGTSQNCASGFVWREAFVGDAICVAPQRRTDSWQENSNAGVGPDGNYAATTTELRPPPPGPPRPAAPDAQPNDNINEPPYQPVCTKWRGANSDELILAEDNGYNVFSYTSLTGQASFEGHGGPQVTGTITSHGGPGVDGRNLSYDVRWSNGWVSSYKGQIEADGTAQGTFDDYSPKGEHHSGHWKSVDKFVCDQ